MRQQAVTVTQSGRVNGQATEGKEGAYGLKGENKAQKKLEREELENKWATVLQVRKVGALILIKKKVLP